MSHMFCELTVQQHWGMMKEKRLISQHISA